MATSPDLPSGTVTFLFTDIEGSTKLAQGHPHLWESLRERHHAILQSAIEAHNGYVFQIIGDAFCTAFRTAGDALGAAIRSQLGFHSEDWGDTPVRVRMGIHTGKAEIKEKGDYHGYLAMSRVQRLMSAGHGGQVLISAATQELLLEDLSEDVSLRDLGERRLKDLIRPEHVYQLIIPGLPTEFPPLKTLDLYRHNLPVQLTSFIGREKTMEEIKQTILAHRLVTLTGAGGTGKTRLALQVVADLLDQFPEGIWFVELAPLTIADFIPQAVLSAVGIPEQPGQSLQQQLVDYFRGKKLLLVLDNCEHLLQACAEVVNTLLRHSNTLRVMVTSREGLGISGEVIWHVSSLSLPDLKQLPSIEQLSQYEAMQLFIERATLVQPHFQVTKDNAPAIAQICFRLDGIPLAIELAAARVKALGVDQISKRLDDRFRLLSGGSRTALERHQTLRATIDWSYNLLSKNEKLLLCRLSVFVSGWTLEAAEQVCGEKDNSNHVLDLLTHLVDKSLVFMKESAINNRYHLLETTRQYAREKLLDLEDGKTLRDRHLAYFLELAEQADKEIHGPGQVQWMDRLDLEHDNFRAAFEWCATEEKKEVALRLLGALVWTWTRRGHLRDVDNWFDKVLSLPRLRDYPKAYAKLLNSMGQYSWTERGRGYKQSLLEESLSIWQSLGVDGEQGLAETLVGLGDIIRREKKDIEAAEALYRQSFELYQRHANEWGMARVMYVFGFKAMLEGRYAEAEQQFMKSLTTFKELGDKWWQSYGYSVLGDLARLLSDYAQAENFHERNLQLDRELGIDLSTPFMNLAWISLRRGNYRKASILFEESLKLCIQNVSKQSTIGCLAGYASILGRSGKPEQAAKLFGAVNTFLESYGPMEPADKRDYDYYLATVRKQLGEVSFAKASGEGRDMTLKQAVAFALKESDE